MIAYLSVFVVLINREDVAAHSSIRHKALLQPERTFNYRGSHAVKRSDVETITMEFQAENVIKLFDRDRKFEAAWNSPCNGCMPSVPSVHCVIVPSVEESRDCAILLVMDEFDSSYLITKPVMF
jgi:hypothetical protein